MAALILITGTALAYRFEEQAAAVAADDADDDQVEVLTADEAAAFLGVDRKTVYDGAGRGTIPHQRLGKRILFSRSQLVSWLGACKVASSGKG
jgi:excisionase family DNA binding protein